MEREPLKRIKPRILPMTFKVNEDELQEIVKFVNERDWKISAFLRTCVRNEIDRLNSEKK